MKNETAMREIESLDYYLQNHTNDYSEKSHTAMMMAIEALQREIPKNPVVNYVADKEIRGWEEIIIETKDGELIVDITAENYIAKDGYSIRLVPCEDKNL